MKETNADTLQPSPPHAIPLLSSETKRGRTIFSDPIGAHGEWNRLRALGVMSTGKKRMLIDCSIHSSPEFGGEFLCALVVSRVLPVSLKW